jgi:hypothetical protein
MITAVDSVDIVEPCHGNDFREFHECFGTVAANADPARIDDVTFTRGVRIAQIVKVDVREREKPGIDGGQRPDADERTRKIDHDRFAHPAGQRSELIIVRTPKTVRRNVHKLLPEMVFDVLANAASFFLCGSP